MAKCLLQKPGLLHSCPLFPLTVKAPKTNTFRLMGSTAKLCSTGKSLEVVLILCTYCQRTCPEISPVQAGAGMFILCLYQWYAEGKGREGKGREGKGKVSNQVAGNWQFCWEARGREVWLYVFSSLSLGMFTSGLVIPKSS